MVRNLLSLVQTGVPLHPHPITNPTGIVDKRQQTLGYVFRLRHIIMPVFREHVRSSDSTDFERTSTLQDIEEMTHGEQVRHATSLDTNSI